MKTRPDPDEILKQIQAEEPSRGKLKIFLGYAAGVGKTYAMLESGHQRQQQGVDVVIGYIETHDRVDTEALVHGFEILPRKQVEYHHINLPELNTDEVIKRRPKLVLVDEFAHTNAPGSRHPKRYLDVEDILDAGINVYTTLNIQHLESMNDVVAQVTGVIVRETVPDRVLDYATEIEVIDLPPDELLNRLKEGKVYVPEQAQRAIEKFFRKGNLSALRELSLRRAAERIDNQVRNYMRTRAIQGPWAVAERLLVYVSSSPLAEKLVRTTRRLSDELNADWFAVHVDLTSKPDLNSANIERVAKTMQLAEDLGAHTRTLVGRSIPESVLAYAKKHNVTKIVVGKPIRPRWLDRLSGSLVDQLMYASGDIDIYVINEQPEIKPANPSEEFRPHSPYWRYLIALLMVVFTTFIGYLIHTKLEPVNLVMVYLVNTMVAAVYLGRGPALLTSILGVLAFDFFLVPPYFSFAVSDTQYFITFIGLFLVSFVVSSLTARSQKQTEAAIQREAHTSALYMLGRDLTSATDLHQVAEIVLSHISEVFGRDVAIFLPENGALKLFATTGDYAPDANEMAVASWAFEHDQSAGLGTDTLPAVSLRCQPLKTARGQIGVLGIHLKEGEKYFSPEQRQTFDAFANQAALAVERAGLAEQARQSELLQATEKLQAALLNSISHDLRTPLVSITGALSSLREESLNINQEGRDSLLETAYSEAERLNRLVANLLNMTRLEANAIHLRLEPCDIQDAIGSALDQLEERLEKRPIVVTIPEGLPLVSLDFALFGQVLVNVIDNADKYSPKDSQIDIDVTQTEKVISIHVCDRGIGIPEEDLERVFDKFYRVSRPESINGTGLGLAICKGIVETHGGQISAANRQGGGTVITITLPKVND